MIIGKKTLGTIGLATVACAACCLPLAAPMLTWLGISALGAGVSGWHLEIAGIAALGLAAYLVVRQRMAAAPGMSANAACAGKTSCANTCATVPADLSQNVEIP
ncbi:MAG: hypothetical protein V4805_09790 [Pseudomonadota bacterium]